ncbi:MAG: hypothetical protein ACR5K4_02530 [Sodalis sp. (in: enterobacteria)]
MKTGILLYYERQGAEQFCFFPGKYKFTESVGTKTIFNLLRDAKLATVDIILECKGYVIST